MSRLILVCGGRDYSDHSRLGAVLREHVTRDDVLIEGGARGVDTLARQWAVENGVHVATVNALWDYYGKSAGFLRNTAMRRLRPDLVIAFPGGVGTAMMVELAAEHDIPVEQIS